MDSDKLVQRRAHNASIPVGKLPMEILAEIFYLCIVGSFPEVEMYILLESLYEVSAHWYNVVSGSPRLWAFTSARWPLEKNRRALKLSGNHPLEVDTSGEDLENKTLGLVLPSSRRWRSARIGAPQDERLLRILKDLAAPQLEILEVVGPGGPIEINLQHPTLLHTLGLRSVSNPLLWSSNVFVGLRRLKVEAEDNSLPSLKDLLRILESSPQLEDLFFSLWSLEDPDTGMMLDSSQAPVNMNQLQNVYFDVPWDYMSRILELVNFPAVVMAEFSWHDLFSAPLMDHAAHVKLLSSLPLPPDASPSKLTIISDKYLFKFSSDHRTIIGDTCQIFMVSDDLEAMSFSDLAKDFAHFLREHSVPLQRPYLCTKWNVEHDINLDEVFRFEEVAFFQEQRWPSKFAEFISALENPPAGRARWLFHAMDTLRIYYTDNLTCSMESILEVAIREREHCAWMETGPLPEEYQPRPLERLILLGPTKPAESVMTLLNRTLRNGHVEWIERHSRPDGYYGEDL